MFAYILHLYALFFFLLFPRATKREPVTQIYDFLVGALGNTTLLKGVLFVVPHTLHLSASHHSWDLAAKSYQSEWWDDWPVKTLRDQATNWSFFIIFFLKKQNKIQHWVAKITREQNVLTCENNETACRSQCQPDEPFLCFLDFLLLVLENGTELQKIREKK